METVAGIISKARQSNQLLLREVGAAIGLDPSMVSKYEKGERLPTLKQIELLADFFKIDKAQLTIVYLSDKVLHEVGNSPYALQALQMAWTALQEKKRK